jgi:uncharacterized protein YciI
MKQSKPSRAFGEPPEEMTSLFLGLMKKGPTWSPDATAEVIENQRKHLALLQRLGEAGDLLLAGPIPEGEVLRGIVVCRAASVEEAEARFADDAHIQTGRLILEWHPWLVPTEVLRRPLLHEP